MTQDKSLPNPEWVTAPFSVSGVADLDTLNSMVKFYGKQFGAVAMEKQPVPDSFLWAFTIRQVDPL